MGDVILQRVFLPLHFSADILVYEMTLKKENVIHFHDGTKTCDIRSIKPLRHTVRCLLIMSSFQLLILEEIFPQMRRILS